jgi:hypothetical protein
MVKGEVNTIKDLKIISYRIENGFNTHKFECLFCLNKNKETIGEHFIFLNKIKEYHCRKRNNNKK